MIRFIATGCMLICLAGCTVEEAAPPSTTVRFTVTEGSWMSVDVSPGGRHILFDLVGHLYEMPIQGGTARRLTSGWAWHRAPSYSPDGRLISMVRDGEGADEVWVMNRDGSGLRRLTNHSIERVERDGWVRGSPTWAPDGRSIVFGTDGEVAGVSGFPDLRRVTLDDGRITSLEADPPKWDRRSGVLSKDGNTLYLTERQESTIEEYRRGAPAFSAVVTRVNLSTGERTPVAKNTKDVQTYMPVLSDDGVWLAYVTREADKLTTLRVRRADDASGQERVLLELEDEDDPYRFDDTDTRPAYSFTPDSRYIVIGSAGKIHKIAVADGSDSIIPFEATVERETLPYARASTRLDDGPVEIRDIQWPQLTPDGKTLVFTAVGYLWKQILPDGQPHRITAQDAGRFELVPALSADGKTLAYVVLNRDAAGVVSYQILTAQLAGGEPRAILTSPDKIIALGWSADGKRLAFARETNTKVIFSWIIPGESAAHLVAQADRGYPNPWNALVSFSQDGQSLRYSWNKGVFEGAELHEAGLSGAEDRTMALAGFGARGILSSPDGRHALVRGVDEDLWLRALAQDGSTTRADFSDPQLQRITSSGAEYVSWQSDRTLIYSHSNRIYRYTLGDAAPTLMHTVKLAYPRRQGTETIAFVNGRIITINGAKGAGDVFENGTLVIQGRRIQALGPADQVSIPKTARIVDATGLTLMPGLLDVHYHPDFGGLSRPFDYTEAPSFGITTVWIPSQTPWSEGFMPIADLCETGRLSGPRWSVAQYGVTLISNSSPPPRMFSRYEDAARIVRHRADRGAVVLKEYLTARRDHRRWFVQVAREAGLGIVSHVQGIEQALSRAADGYTGIDHVPFSVPVYDDVRQFLARTGTIWTPNFIVTGSGLRNDEGEGTELDAYFKELFKHWPELQAKQVHYHPQLMQVNPSFRPGRMSRVAKAAAYLMAGGAKVGVSSHNPPGLTTHFEIWMLQQAGAPRGDVLRAATLINAQKIGMDGDIGSLEPGKIADILVLKANPLQDVIHTAAQKYVVTNGVIQE